MAEAKKETNKSAGMDPKLAALLSWIFSPLSSLIFILMEDMKKDEFIQFHAKQSLFWAIAEVVLGVTVGIISIIPFVQLITCLLGPVLLLLSLGVRIYGAYKGYQGEKVELPIIGEMAAK
jgi:uncharacterized membrane protein